MKFLLSLAVKNLARYGKRTMITAAAIALGLGLFILTDSLLKGMERDSEINLINYETASAKVMHPDYLEEKDTLPLDLLIEKPAPLLDKLASAGTPAVPRVLFKAEIFVNEDPYPEDGSLYVKAIALDPARDGRVYKLEETLMEGRFLEPAEEGLLLGSWLAEDLGAKVGYPLTVRTRTRYGSYETMELPIVGILNIPNPVMNRGTIFIPLDTADYYLQMDGAVSEVALRFSHRVDPDREASRIETFLGDSPQAVAVNSWKKIAPDYVAMAAMKKSGSNSILFLVVLIAAVGITNTMLMAVYERMRELGMMRAMGMSSWQIRLTFLFEAAGIGLIGSTVGVLFGVLINWPLVYWGIDYSTMLRDLEVGYRIASIMRSMWNIPTIITGFFAGILISMGVALIPIRRAVKMQITDCLRNE